MSEERLSNKLDIEGAQRISAGEEKLKESYKVISEDIGLTHVTGDTVKNSNMVRENGDSAQDGADEKMLGSDDKESLALKNVEVKFISGDQNANGDAKIDIGHVEKTFTGMTKEELMKYANDPFWVKLRWVLFILFWALWVAMLAGAIAIIVYAPKCAQPTPLVWWKKGPLITIDGNENEQVIDEIKKLEAKGVVYELSPEETYFVETPIIENRIKKIVEDYSAKDIHVVLDLTANYVPENDKDFQQAISSDPNPEALSAFVHSDKVNNWLQVGGDGSAWKKRGNHQFLSQFGNNFDLQMSSEKAQEKLIGVLTHLTGLGVKGFRLKNAKHFIIDPALTDETMDNSKPTSGAKYSLYTHAHTTHREDSGDLIHKFTKAVHNLTNGEGFLTIYDDAAYRAEVYTVKKTEMFGFDLPRLAFLNLELQSSAVNALGKIKSGFDNLAQTVNLPSMWMQVNYKPENFKNLKGAAYNMFMSLLPGVQIVPIEALKYDQTNNTDVIEKLQETRLSPVFQHGSFEYLLSQNETAFGYIRIKSGNPGYFVAVNPSDFDIVANFTSASIGPELSYFMSSDHDQKGKVSAHAIPLAKNSVGIFTFVPK